MRGLKSPYRCLLGTEMVSEPQAGLEGSAPRQEAWGSGDPHHPGWEGILTVTHLHSSLPPAFLRLPPLSRKRRARATKGSCRRTPAHSPEGPVPMIHMCRLFLIPHCPS